MNLSQGLPSVGDYGHGDRLTGIRYSVSTFVSGATRGDFRLRRVGTWQSEQGYIPCTAEGFLQGAATGGCKATIEWGTPGNKQPSDRPEGVVSAMPESVSAFLTALFAIQLATAIFVAAVFARYHNVRILKASQWQVMCVVLSSLFLGAGRILVASYGETFTVATCVAGFWLGHLTFVGVIALLGMTLRVYIIVNAGLKKVKVRISDVFKFITVVSSVLVIYMIIVSAANPQEEHHYTTTAVNGQVTHIYHCAARQST